MSHARDLVRELWKYGVRVESVGDRFKLTPAGVAPDELRDRLRAHRHEVTTLRSQLPTGGRCPICGDPNGWPEKTGLHCTACALIAVAGVLDDF
jgi:hypothetical protein